MEIILTENVEGLGQIGDLVRVKPGYARNYLVPKGLAVVANNRNIKELEHQKRQAERKFQRVVQAAEVLKGKIEALNLQIAHKAGEEGKLYGAVTAMELEAKLAEQGVEIDRRKIQLDEPIKNVGDFEVPVKLDAGVSATIKLSVVAEAE
ncbi:MAG: 50S ribosomal protein L9 [Geothermobacteraceae bacterium]